jgi:hypothetical protein
VLLVEQVHRGVVWWWISSAPAISDVIDYITISTLGNAQDFGNLLASKKMEFACSSRLVAYLVEEQPSAFCRELIM